MDAVHGPTYFELAEEADERLNFSGGQVLKDGIGAVGLRSV